MRTTLHVLSATAFFEDMKGVFGRTDVLRAWKSLKYRWEEPSLLSLLSFSYLIEGWLNWMGDDDHFLSFLTELLLCLMSRFLLGKKDDAKK